MTTSKPTPAVSVIVTAQNAVHHMHETLESLASQSFLDFEVIVVDDGSTDGSSSIVESFAARDDRFRHIQVRAVGSAGVAKNAGLKVAHGEYLAFLDADELFAPSMLAKLYDKAKADDADVVLTGLRSLDDVTGEEKIQAWSLRSAYIPSHSPFSPNDLADHLFYVTNPAASNKMFRRQLVEDAKVAFQPLWRENDAFFTYFSLASAHRISVVDEALVKYRIGGSASLESSIHEAPHEIAEAMSELCESLDDVGLFKRHERAFTNLVATMSLAALHRARTATAFKESYAEVRNSLFPRYGLDLATGDTFLSPTLSQRVSEIVSKPMENWLFDRAQDPEGSASPVRRDLHKARQDVEVENAMPADASRVAKPTEGSPDLSVIIPVYNAASWLHECLLSILGQTGLTLEVICVNDGSTDESLSILHEYATSDPRILVIDRPNGGQSVARNAGLAIARGRYTCMIDSDDYWQVDGLSGIVEHADRERLDVLLFDGESFFEPGASEKSRKAYETYYTRKRSYSTVLEGTQLMVEMDKGRDYRVSPCLYIFRTAMLHSASLNFIPGIMHEDNPFTFALLLTAKRAAHVKLAIYARRVRPGSIMTAGTLEPSMKGYFASYLAMVRFLSHHPVSDELTTAVDAIVVRTLISARRLFLQLPAESGDRIQEVDSGPEVHGLYTMLRNDRIQRQKIEKLSNTT